MSELSPAAQVVLDAYFTEADRLDREVSNNEMLAAALRAAADQVFPLERIPWGSTLTPVLTSRESRSRLLAIANELENHQ